MAPWKVGVVEYIQNERTEQAFLLFDAHMSCGRASARPIPHLKLGCRRRTEVPRNVITVMCLREAFVVQYKKTGSQSKSEEVAISLSPSRLFSGHASQTGTPHQSIRTPLPR
jgi:hypothetical protein